MSNYTEMSCFGYNGPGSGRVSCTGIQDVDDGLSQKSSIVRDPNFDTMSKPVEYFPAPVETVFAQTKIPEKTLSVSDLLAYIRGMGWRVHAHYDAYTFGRSSTRWTFVRNGVVKSEYGNSDLEALLKIQKSLMTEIK